MNAVYINFNQITDCTCNIDFQDYIYCQETLKSFMCFANSLMLYRCGELEAELRKERKLVYPRAMDSENLDKGRDFGKVLQGPS